jgi:molybdopterin-containing oxidoreductase family iron-sulfur binding subunit
MALDFDTTNGEPTGAGSAPEQFHSLEHLLGTPEFQRALKDEFPEDASEWLDPVSRRRFLALSGASLALAGAVGCNPSLKPASQKKIIPYVKKPEAITPGVPLFFPTAITLGGVGLGVLVKSHEGRPIKVEGNPSHPGSLGATDVYAQAALLGVYDPERSKGVTEKGQPATWEKARAALAALVGAQVAKGGAGLRVVTEAVAAGTVLATMLGELKAKLPGMKWIQYEAVGRENALKGVKAAYGKYLTPIYELAKADTLVAIDSDIESHCAGAGVRNIRAAMSRRKVRIHEDRRSADGVPLDRLSRIYAVESMVSGFGGVADHRLPLKPSEIESFVRELAKELGVAGPAAGPLPDRAKAWVKAVAEDLKDAKKPGVVVGGETLSVAAQNLIHAINDKINAVKNGIVRFVEPVQAGLTGPDADAVADGTASLKALADEMNAGKVDALLVLGGNPAFTAPADLGFAAALQKVTTTFHLGLYQDETATLTTWHVNAAHELEAWGDARAYDGTATIQQPMISLHGGKSILEVVGALLDKPGSAETLVREAWQKHFTDKKLPGEFDSFWHKGIERGVVEGTASPAAMVAAAVVAPATASAPAPATKADEIELSFRPDPTLYDGRFANNGWLQETPKPVTRITWDNAALVSPHTAERLKCEVSYRWTGGEHGSHEVDKIELTVDGRKARVPVFVLPGHADDVITLHFGYGREKVGVVGKGTGFNVYPLRTTANLWTVGGIKPQPDSAERTQEKYVLACTQGQHAMEGRRPARHGTATQAALELKVEDHGDHKHYHMKDHHKDAFSFADNPPVSAGEKDLMRALLPGTPKERAWLADPHHPQEFHKKGYKDNVHKHEEKADATKEEAEHHEHDKRLVPLTLIQDHPDNKLYRRWAMAIDLGACTGCSTCVTACVAENNIPVVGKAEVTRGRIMHWIRIDRYFAIPEEKGGTEPVDAKTRAEKMKHAAADITTHFQPVLCQQCEKAPCELVCPVAATAHSADGLNDMAYNRCVGTRYCANNCPYKVRRFNFLQYANYEKDNTLQLVNNPEVTLRTRGVMEKCTYCVQRIRNAEIEAEREHDNPNRVKVKTPLGVRPLIAEGEVRTACQAACPANAISFGDLNYDQYVPVKKQADGTWKEEGRHLPFSEVARWKLEATNYGLLAELNTMPRTSYLAAIKNPNPKLA